MNENSVNSVNVNSDYQNSVHENFNQNSNDHPNDPSDHSKAPGQTLILLISLGTPASASLGGIARFLSQFLSDPRVIVLPVLLRPIWWMVLHFIIIPLRIFKVRKWYRAIWTAEGSPLFVNTQALAKALQAYINAINVNSNNKVDTTLENNISNIKVIGAMTYGNPKLSQFIQNLFERHSSEIKKLIVLPLFPLYSNTTTAPIFDAAVQALQKQKRLPEFYFIEEYASRLSYLKAIQQSILKFWEASGRGEKLLFSFHGIPVSQVKKGDPYYHHCVKLAYKLADLLQLSEQDWAIGFQSRFGFTEWVGPAVEEILIQWQASGIQSVDVVSPSFAIDCLETLEEIGHRYREYFLSLGGGSLRYIPALNDNPLHVSVLGGLIENFFKKNEKK